MRLTTALLFGIALLLGSPAARADEPAPAGVPDVQLFGGIRWDSSPADVIAKLNKLNPTTLVVGLNQYQFSVDMKGKTTEAAIDKELEALYRKPLIKPTEIARKGALASSYVVFKDNAGKEWHRCNKSMQIKATGIVIAGVIYDLSMQTMESLGVIELTPQNVVWWKSEPAIALAIAVSDMHLKPVSGSADQKHAVFEALRKKYPAMTEDYEHGADLAGTDGIVSFLADIGITYRRQRDSERRYEKAARAYTDRQNSAGKKDQSNSL